jgi:hypothetical protein
VGCVGACRVLFKGLRVRMGVHWGKPRVVKDPMTRRVEYIGPVVNAAARITALTHGGTDPPSPPHSLDYRHHSLIARHVAGTQAKCCCRTRCSTN